MKSPELVKYNFRIDSKDDAKNPRRWFQVYNVSRRILQEMHCRLCDAQCQEARLSLGMRACVMGS